jgi:hypothetical protein
MNNYYLDQVTNKPVKIGSKAYIKSLKTKISDNYETKTIMNNISYESYLKIKENLPKIDNNQFYCYQIEAVIIKNKSIKISDFSKHLESVLPSIIDQIVESIQDSDISNIRESIKNIFHNSLIH